MAFEYKNIGFIGLGLMGVPMVQQLLKKTPESTQFHLFDVATEPVDEICQKWTGRAHRCGSSREVAEKSVCTTYLVRLAL
jgi:3-hydroxyisobutyrate dehydrogenase